MRASQSAFTILELTIVMAIIGLLIGGVLGGKSLLRASQVNQVVTDVTSFRIASDQFMQQFEWLPGDMPYATQMWGRADGGTDLTVNCSTMNAQGTGKTTCNGNGDGQITANVSFPELHRTWQHMANAGYLKGTFTGVAGPSHATFHVVPGTNAPAGPWRKTGYAYYGQGVYANNSNANYFDGDYRDMFVFGAETTTYPSGNALSPKEAYDIDVKTDDGMPGMGNVVTFKGNGVNNNSRDCADSAVQTTAVYKRSASDMRCSLMFLRGFKAKKTA